jgi:DNA-binding IclR family transcriptional regulator
VAVIYQPPSLWYASGIVTLHDLRQEEAELITLRKLAEERRDVEQWERFNEELNRVRRDVWEALRLAA